MSRPYEKLIFTKLDIARFQRLQMAYFCIGYSKITLTSLKSLDESSVDKVSLTNLLTNRREYLVGGGVAGKNALVLGKLRSKW